MKKIVVLFLLFVFILPPLAAGYDFPKPLGIGEYAEYIGDRKVIYDYFRGRISQIGNERFHYDGTGYIEYIGDRKVIYDCFRGRISQIGNERVIYSQ